MKISIIMAVAENGVIGDKDLSPLWHLRSDLKKFKEITTGHPIIMGRKTFETIGHPLKNRINIVMTRQKNYYPEGCIVANDVNQALDIAKTHDDKCFVIGGSEIFRQFIDIADELLITKVKHCPKGLTQFRYDDSVWQEISKEDHNSDNHNTHDFTHLRLVTKASRDPLTKQEDENG